MKPAAYRTKSGLLFKNAPDAPLELTPLYEMPKPLSDEEIEDIYCEVFCLEKGSKPATLAYEFVKAIEERHGIK